MIPFGRKRTAPQPGLSRKQALSCIPVKVPSIQEVRTESQTIRISFVDPLPPVLAAIQKAFGKAATGRMRRLELDRIGTTVWEWIDGKRTVSALAHRFVERYGVLPQEAELSVSQFLRELGRRGIIVLRLPEQP